MNVWALLCASAAAMLLRVGDADTLPAHGPADAQSNAQTFMDALRGAEQSSDVGPLVGLFAADAECGSITTKEPATGPEAIKRFWLEYLSVFKTVRSTFVHTRAAGDAAALEWTSEGQLATTGAAINYQGVSLLEFDAAGKVKRFRTYFDSAAFLPEGAKTIGREVKV